MKKKRIAIAISAALAVIAAIAAVLFINLDFNAQKISADLYFMNERGTGIIAETHEIKYRSNYDFVEKIMERLRKGPSVSKHGRIMPRDTLVLNIEFSTDEPGSVAVDLSQDYLTDNPSRNVLNTYAVVKSLCSVSWISKVRVTVNGNDITDADGNALGFVTASDINLETEEYSSEMRDVVLYFGDHSEKMLVREERTIKITDQQPIEQYIINELIKGPENKNLKSVLSPDTVLMSVDVEDNICYLNFKSSFISENSGDADHERLVIYSIVNSLTELKTISRVQFYMDGKRIESFGSFNIKNYISRDISIIQQQSGSAASLFDSGAVFFEN